MDFEIRAITPEDELRHREMMAQAFSRGRVQMPLAEGQTGDVAGGWGVYVGGAMVACLTLIPFDVQWGGGHRLPLGGIAGVATVPEARGRGYVAALLKHTLERMRERGQVISALYPFAYAFYRRHGWEWVGERHTVTIPLRELGSYAEGKYVREVRAAAAVDTLKPIFDAYGQGYRGLFTADCHKWNEKLAANDNRLSYVYVYQEPDREPDGYLIWRYRSSGETGDVREFVARTPAAYRGLLSIVHHLGTQCRNAEFDAMPADHSLWSHVMHWDVETKASPVFMARVVDVPAALEALAERPELPDGAVTLSVHDDSASWNAATWRVACEAGRVTCSRATEDADVTLDIQAFSQAYWGTPDLSRLIQAGRAQVKSAAAAEYLSQILAGPPVWTADFF